MQQLFTGLASLAAGREGGGGCSSANGTNEALEASYHAQRTERVGGRGGSMFFRIAQGKIAHGKWEEFEMAYRQAVHAAGKQRGLSGRWLIRDMGDPDAYYGITKWESLETLKAYEIGASQDIMTAVSPFMATEFTMTYCEERYLWLAIEDYSGV